MKARLMMAGLGLYLAALPAVVRGEPACGSYWITGYVRGDGNPHTADGTDIFTDEPIAASGYDLDFGTMVTIEDVGTFRIADRGYLGPRWIDVAVWSVEEAYALTGYRWACVEES